MPPMLKSIEYLDGYVIRVAHVRQVSLNVVVTPAGRLRNLVSRRSRPRWPERGRAHPSLRR